MAALVSVSIFRMAGRVAHKSLRFAPDSYLFDRDSEVKENGAGIPHLLSWRSGFGDRTAYAASGGHEDAVLRHGSEQAGREGGRRRRRTGLSRPAERTRSRESKMYFLGVFLPREQQTVTTQTLSDSVQLTPEGGEVPVIGVGVGGEGRNEFSVFVGPKDVDLFRRVNPKLAGAVDFGWFSILARPIFLTLKWLHNNCVQTTAGRSYC